MASGQSESAYNNREPFVNAYLLLFVELLVSLAASLALLWMLSRPLLDVLVRICPDEPAAAFWLSYTRIMLVIAPVLLVLIADLCARFKEPMDSLRLALIVTLTGLLIGMRSIGKRLGQFVVTPPRNGGAP